MALHPETLGRLRRLEHALERMDPPTREGETTRGPVRRVARAQRLGPGHKEAGKIVGYHETYFYGGRPIRWVS